MKEILCFTSAWQQKRRCFLGFSFVIGYVLCELNTNAAPSRQMQWFGGSVALSSLVGGMRCLLLTYSMRSPNKSFCDETSIEEAVIYCVYAYFIYIMHIIFLLMYAYVNIP